MIISHVKIIAFQTIIASGHFYIGGKPVVYIINRKIHGCLDIPDLFLVLTMIFLTRSLRSLVKYHVQHSKKIWYFRAPMYYSLYIIRDVGSVLTIDLLHYIRAGKNDVKDNLHTIVAYNCQNIYCHFQKGCGI